MVRPSRPALPPPERRPKLLFVRVYLGKPRMDVFVEDTLWKKRRVIRYKWMKRDTKEDPKVVPPKRWWEAICGEVEYQRQRDFKKKIHGEVTLRPEKK